MSTETMRAILYLEPGRLEAREIPIPRPGPGDILVRVRAALTCGTDVKTYRRGHPKIPPPTVFGHEFAGDVVEVGASVRGFTPGMRVVAHNTAPCGHCFECKHGQPNLCDQLVYNFGAFAEYIRVPDPIVRQNTFEIPPGVAYEEAAIMEPLSTVVHGQRVIDIQPGETVAIIGAGGPIGLMHVQMAARRGATRIIAVDLVNERLAVARRLGATNIVNSHHEDAAATIRALTGGRGADVCIESAGAPAAWLTAMQATRKGGRVLWFGGLAPGATIELDTLQVHYGELTLHGVYHSTPLDVLDAFNLITSRVIDAQALITTEMPLEQVEDALQLMMAGKIVKAAIRPSLRPTPEAEAPRRELLPA